MNTKCRRFNSRLEKPCSYIRCNHHSLRRDALRSQNTRKRSESARSYPTHVHAPASHEYSTKIKYVNQKIEKFNLFKIFYSTIYTQWEPDGPPLAGWTRIRLTSSHTKTVCEDVILRFREVLERFAMTRNNFGICDDQEDIRLVPDMTQHCTDSMEKKTIQTPQTLLIQALIPRTVLTRLLVRRSTAREDGWF